MATLPGRKILELVEAPTTDDADAYEVSQGGVSKHIKFSTLKTAILSTSNSSIGSLSTGLSTNTSRINSLSTSTSTGLSTSVSGIASLSTSLSTTNSSVASLSTSTSTGLSTSVSRLNSLSTGLSTSNSSISSLSTSVSTLDAQNVKLTGDQTIAGTKSFGNSFQVNNGLRGSWYNTTDKTTNVEVGYIYWNSNEFTIATASAGTGVTRTIAIQGVGRFQTAVLPFTVLGFPTATSTLGIHNRVSSNFVGSTGNQTTFEIQPTIAQTGTAGFTALAVNPTISGSGSGLPLLQSWAVGGALQGVYRSNGNFATSGTITAGSAGGIVQGNSYLNSLGAFAIAPTLITTSTTLGITHGSVTVNATSAPIVITLPAASSCSGRIYDIKRLDGSSYTITILPSGVELIDYQSSYVLERSLSGVVLRSDGSRWLISSITEPSSLIRSQPIINLMSDSGKGTVRANPLNNYAAAYDNAKQTLWFVSYNGAGVWSEAGKFIFDNSTNGGAAGALTTTVSDLLATMGRTGTSARYGTEFYVHQRTSGTAVLSAHPLYPTNYLGSTMAASVQGVMNANSVVTFAGWFRCIDGTKLVLGLNGSPAQVVYKNGVKVNIPSEGVIVTPAEGWVHYRIVSRVPIGYDNALPKIYAEVSQTYQMALPVWSFGEVNPGLHTSPIQTINELIP